MTNRKIAGLGIASALALLAGSSSTEGLGGAFTLGGSDGRGHGSKPYHLGQPRRMKWQYRDMLVTYRTYLGKDRVAGQLFSVMSGPDEIAGRERQWDRYDDEPGRFFFAGGKLRNKRRLLSGCRVR